MSELRGRNREVRSLSTAGLAGLASAAWLVAGCYRLVWGRGWDLDLRVYRAAGHSLLSGANPYLSTFTAHHLSFTYTPFALLLLTPLAWGPVGVVSVGWWVAGASALTGVAQMAVTRTTARRAGQALAVAALLAGVSAIALEPVRSGLNYGQIDTILMFLIVLDVAGLPRRAQGVLIGLAAAFKLTPLVFVVYYVVQRQWRPVLRCLATFLGATVIGWIVLPSESARYWWVLLYRRGHVGTVGYRGNQSWLGLLFRAHVRHGFISFALWSLLGVVTLAAGAFVVHRLARGGRTIEAVLALALVELLVSPISWTHHWSWLVLAPLVAVTAWPEHRLVATLLWAVLVVAVAAPYWWMGPAWAGDDSLVLMGAAVLVGWTVTSWREARPADSRVPSYVRGS